MTRAVCLDAALARTFFRDVTVTDSRLQIVNVLATDNTATVGNGTNRTSLDFAQLAARFQF